MAHPPTRSIAFVSNTAWSVFRFRRPIIERLLARNCRVIVIAPRDPYADRLEAMGCELHDVAIDSKGTNPFKDFLLILKLWRIYGRTRPQLSFNYTIKCSIYATIAGSLRGVRSIPVITGAGHVFGDRTWIAAIAKRLYAYAFSRASEVWFLNRDDLALFSDEKLVPAAKSRLLPSEGVETFELDALRRAHTFATPASNEFRFLLIARLIREKGIYEYVAAAKQVRERHPHARFQVLGFLGVDNPSAIARETIARWHDEGTIDYLGTTDDVAQVILGADVVVLPSYYREGIPRALLEAASLGRPIIATDSVGCRETVDDGVSGYLVEPRNATDLADKMVRMLGLPRERLAQMGNAGRDKMVRQFDVSFVEKRYLQAIGLDGEALAT